MSVANAMPGKSDLCQISIDGVRAVGRLEGEQLVHVDGEIGIPGTKTAMTSFPGRAGRPPVVCSHTLQKMKPPRLRHAARNRQISDNDRQEIPAPVTASVAPDIAAPTAKPSGRLRSLSNDDTVICRRADRQPCSSFVLSPPRSGAIISISEESSRKHGMTGMPALSARPKGIHLAGGRRRPPLRTKRHGRQDAVPCPGQIHLASAGRASTISRTSTSTCRATAWWC